MESHGQGVGDGHETTLTVGLHVIFLAADIDDDLAGLWSLDAEIGTALLVNLREFVAGNGSLCGDGIGGNLYALGHINMRALGFIAQETGHSLAVAAAEFAIAGSIEMQTVRTIGAVVGRDNL